MNSKFPLTLAERQKVIRLARQYSLDVAILAERFGVGHGVILSVLRKAGIDRNRPPEQGETGRIIAGLAMRGQPPTGV